MEVILKVTERCNINCTYCYFFNLGNEDYKSHPPYIGATTIEQCADFLAEAARTGEVQELQIDFHGGEPLMMKKERFDAMCETFYSRLSEVPTVRLVLQTNAMLIDDEWIDLFAKHRIGIGISIDGPKENHDKYRVDHRGKGTYDATIAGLTTLQAAIRDGRLQGSGVGLICVIDPEQDARTVFSHFVDELELHAMNVSLPMYDHDTVPAGVNEKTSKYLCDLFDVWAERADPRISIRYFRHLFGQLMSGKEPFDNLLASREKSIVYTIASNGDVGPGDDLRNTFPKLFHTGCNVATSTMQDFVRNDELVSHTEAISVRHADCKACCWGRVCDGGDFVGTEAFRYSRRNGFANKSVYCESIKALLTHMTRFAIKNGVAFDHIAKALVPDQPADEEIPSDAKD